MAKIDPSASLLEPDTGASTDVDTVRTTETTVSTIMASMEQSPDRDLAAPSADKSKLDDASQPSIHADSIPADSHGTISLPPPTSPSAAVVPARTQTQTLILMFALCMAVFLAALDAVIITTALPTIARDIQASDSGYAWIAAAYLLCNAASVPFWGKVSDIFGRKPVLLLANGVFLVGSVVAALASTLTMLVAGRSVQGLGAGGLMALVNITVGDLFSPRERGVYFGMVGGVWGLASGIGPLIGGGFTQNVTWRWCFWIPISVLSLAILTLFLKIHTPPTPLLPGLRAIDWLGTFTFTGATLMLLLGLEFGGVTYPWASAPVLCLILFGVLTYGVFALVETSPLARYPLMPSRLFRNASVLLCYVSNFSHGLCFGAAAYFLPLYFQAALEATPIQSGVWMLAVTLPLAVTTIGTGVVIKKTGRYREIIIGSMACMALAFGLFINFPAHRDWARLVAFQIVCALGVGPNLQALLIALQALVRQEDVAVGTATFAFVRQISVGIGVVVGQVIFQGRMQAHFSSLLDAGIPDDLAERLADGSTISTGHLVSELDPTQRDVFIQSVADSLSKMWIFFAAAAGVGLVASCFIEQIVLRDDHIETKTGLEAEEAKKQDTVMVGEKEAV